MLQVCMFISKWFIFPKKVEKQTTHQYWCLVSVLSTRISDSELGELSSRFLSDNYFLLSRCVALRSLEEKNMKEKI